MFKKERSTGGKICILTFRTQMKILFNNKISIYTQIHNSTNY